MKLPSDGWLIALMLVVSMGLIVLGGYEVVVRGNFIEGTLFLGVGAYAMWRL